MTGRTTYKQVLIRGADHKFTVKVGGRPVSEPMVEAVANWLRDQEARHK
ncbi:MAG: hypothetical protein ACR2PO_02240 [Methyloligellaceae bacterium]